MISKQIKREIDQYKIEDETPQNRMNYNYNVQVLSNKDFKIKNVEKPSKAATLQGFSLNIFKKYSKEFKNIAYF